MANLPYYNDQEAHPTTYLSSAILPVAVATVAGFVVAQVRAGLILFVNACVFTCSHLRVSPHAWVPERSVGDAALLTPPRRCLCPCRLLDAPFKGTRHTPTAFTAPFAMPPTAAKPPTAHASGY
jgi:hypothetical protein